MTSSNTAPPPMDEMIAAAGEDGSHLGPLLYEGDQWASFFGNEPAADETTSSQWLIEGDTALRLAELQHVLPEAQREAVRLRHLEGWPWEKNAA